MFGAVLFNFVSVFCYLFSHIGSVFWLKMAVFELVKTPPIFYRACHFERMRQFLVSVFKRPERTLLGRLWKTVHIGSRI